MLLRLALTALFATSLFAASVFAAEATLELRGHVSGAEEQATSLQVMLFGVESPFSDSAMLNDDGDFQFRALTPGNYTVAVVKQGLGEIRRTVVVTPAVADKNGVVNMTVPYSLSEAAANATGAVVSIQRALVSDKALAKYADAQKRLSLHDSDGAAHALKQAVEIAPQFSAAWNALGVIAFQRGENGKAELNFRRALMEEPGAFDPTLNLGGLLLKMGSNKEALAYNQRAARDRPQDALANAQLGMNYFQLGEFEQAERYLSAAKSLDRAQFSQPQLFLAAIYARRGEREKAAGELKELLAQRPDGPLADSIRNDLRKLQAQ